MLKMCKGYGLLDVEDNTYVSEIYTSSDIKEIVKKDKKDGLKSHYVDVIQKKFVLVAMDSNGNGFYLKK